jgi:hypothetical protein
VRNRVFETRPILFHHPGRTGRGNSNRIEGLIELKRDLFATIREGGGGWFRDRKEGHRLPVPASAAVDEELGQWLTVVFVSNLAEPGSGPRSLDHFGCPYRIIGRDIKRWSFQERLRAIDGFLPEIDTEYMLVADADDVFAVASLRTALERFEDEFDCEMLINAAQNFWPPELDRDPSIRAFCDATPAPGGPEHRYVNGGLWIGRTDFYREIAAEVLLTPPVRPGSDQCVLYCLYQKHHPAIQVDHRCRIFQCEFDEELEWESPPRTRWLRRLAEGLPPSLQSTTGRRRRRSGRKRAAS